MHISKKCKGAGLAPIDFGSLCGGDVFVLNGFTHIKLNKIIWHVEKVSDMCELLDYNAVRVATGELCKYEDHTPVAYQPNATVYLKG